MRTAVSRVTLHCEDVGVALLRVRAASALAGFEITADRLLGSAHQLVVLVSQSPCERCWQPKGLQYKA